MRYFKFIKQIAQLQKKIADLELSLGLQIVFTNGKEAITY